MIDFKNKKFEIFYKIISGIVALIFIYKGFHLLFLAESITKTRYYIFFIVEILVVVTIKVIQIKLKKRKNIFEKILNDTFYTGYKSIQEKINLSQLTYRKKKEVIQDVLEILITAQESGKSIKEVVPDSEKFTADIVDAYGKWSYGIKEILEGFIYASLFFLFVPLFKWIILGCLTYSDHNFFTQKTSIETLSYAVLFFSIPIASWMKQRYSKIDKYLLLIILYLPISIFYTLIHILKYGLEIYYFDFLAADFKLFPNPYVLVQFIVIIFVLFIWMISIRKKVNLDPPLNQLASKESNKNEINRKLIVILVFLLILYITMVAISFNAYDWKLKSFYNTTRLSLNTTPLTKTGANNQNTGLFPETGLPKLTTIAWKKQITTEDHPYCHDLIYNENILYYTDFDSIFALSSTNGSTLWQFKTHRRVNTGFAITKDVLYVGVSQFMFAIDKLNGKQIWRYKPNGFPETNPVVENGIIYFGCDDSNLYALNAISGELIWKFDIGNQGGYDPEHIPSSPAISNEILYIVNDKGLVFAIDAKSGKQIWQHQSSKAVNSAVTVSDDSLFYSTQNALIRLNLKTGQEIWKYDSIFDYKNSFSVGYGLVFINRSRNDGEITDNKTIAIDMKTGKEVWKFNPGEKNEFSTNRLILANHILYIHFSDHFLYALDTKTGKPLWKFNTGNDSDNFVAIGDGRVFIDGVQDGYLCALE